MSELLEHYYDTFAQLSEQSYRYQLQYDATPWWHLSRRWFLLTQQRACFHRGGFIDQRITALEVELQNAPSDLSGLNSPGTL